MRREPEARPLHPSILDPPAKRNALAAGIWLPLKAGFGRSIYFKCKSWLSGLYGTKKKSLFKRKSYEMNGMCFWGICCSAFVAYDNTRQRGEDRPLSLRNDVLLTAFFHKIFSFKELLCSVWFAKVSPSAYRGLLFHAYCSKGVFQLNFSAPEMLNKVCCFVFLMKNNLL